MTGKTNDLPKYVKSGYPDECCPRFDPAPWDGLELAFDKKPFVVGRTRSIFHIPLNMGGMMTRTMKLIEDAKAAPEDFVVLSRDLSPWRGEHLFSVTGDVPGAEMTRLSGRFLTKVFEGPYRDAGKWMLQLSEFAAASGRKAGRMYLYYTTCPKCAREYGKNYVVGFVQADAFR